MSISSHYESIDELIQAQNPFQWSLVVGTDQVWSDGGLDLEDLNKQAFKEMTSAIDLIGSNRSVAGGLSKALGCAIIGPKGWGKTHLLGRIRKFVQKKKKGIFIYSCDYGNLSDIRYQFLQNLVASLRKPNGFGVNQCQTLATALVSQVFRRNYEVSQLLETIDKHLSKNPTYLEKPIDKVVEQFPDLSDPDIVKALIWCLSKKYAPYALKWLSGQELSPKEAALMSLPATSREVQGQLAFQVSLDLLKIIGACTVPVICFDQLDGTDIGPEDISESNGSKRSVHEFSGYKRSIVVTGFICDLFNNLSKGLVITAMYDETFQETQDTDVHAQNFQLDRFAQKQLQLQPLTGQQTKDLLSARLDDFYQSYGFTAPEPTYPFTAEQLAKLQSQRFSVRELFKWAAKNWPTNRPAISSTELLHTSYQEYEKQLENFMDDNALIAQGLIFGFRHLIRLDQVVEKVKVKEVDTNVPQDKLDFRIIGIEGDKKVKIGVSVVQQSNSNSIKARVTHLSNYQKYDLTRGCLVRSKTISLSAFSLQTKLKNLLENLGGEWVNFKAEQLKPILILYKMSKDLDTETISRSDFHDFMDEFYPLQENYILKEILSDPSGQEPDGLIDEDQECQRLQDSLAEDDMSVGNLTQEENDIFV